ERHVEADNHEPEGPTAERLRHHSPAHLRKPVVQATYDGENDRADGDIVEMRDEEVAVLSLPIERHAGMTDSGEARDKELDEKGDAEQHRHLKSDSPAEHCSGPVEHFYPGWNCNQH